MGIIRVQHAFQGVSLQPEDQYVNVFYFQPAASPGSLADLAAAVKSFYHTIPAGESTSLDKYLSGVADAPGASVKMYDLDDAIPRASIYEEFYNPSAFGAGASKNLPNEVALCLSYSAGPASGLPIARRRGRIYVGPFCENALIAAGGTAAESGPNAELQFAIPKGAQSMAEVAAGIGYDWSVYSPSNLEAVSILSCWCDNAWDTQRRRGNKPTMRYTQTITP